LLAAKAAAAGPFGPAVTTGAATKTAGPPPDWIIELVKASMAAKAAKGTPFGASPAAAAPPSFSYKRDVSGGPPPPPAAPPAPQPQQLLAPFNPFFAPYPQFQPSPVASAPQAATPPVQMPMVPMYGPPMVSPFVPYWKMMG
jgi:hypothetical protein